VIITGFATAKNKTFHARPQPPRLFAVGGKGSRVLPIQMRLLGGSRSSRGSPFLAGAVARHPSSVLTERRRTGSGGDALACTSALKSQSALQQTTDGDALKRPDPLLSDRPSMPCLTKNGAIEHPANPVGAAAAVNRVRPWLFTGLDAVVRSSGQPRRGFLRPR